MIERLQGKVENITFISRYDDGVELCSIQIDFDELKIFGLASDFMGYIGKDVLYSKRIDVINGKTEMVVYDLVLLSTIQTVSSTENIKLIPEGNKRTICNIASRTIKFGDFYPNCIALLSKVELGSSPKAKWFDCTCIDSESREFQVRLFSSDNVDSVNSLLNSFIGRYVGFDLESTKYGYQTKEISVLPNDVEQSPEVTVAKEIVEQVINADEGLSDYNKKYNFITQMEATIDGEPGYQLVRMASEIYMINAIDNISTELDIQAMKRAVICSRGYLLPKKTAWSRPMLNTNKILMVPQLKTDKELMLIIDTMSEEESSSTKLTYIKIKGLVDDIIKIRRGIVDEKDNIIIDDMRSVFNGLL